MSEQNAIVFHGPSGSGKDTQARLLSDKLESSVVIGLGNMLREAYKAEIPLAIELHKDFSVGKFVDSKKMYDLLEIWIERYLDYSTWIFVGPVRKIDQIEIFNDFIEGQSRELDYFFHMDLDEETAVERMVYRIQCSNCGEIYHKLHKPEKKRGICDICGNLLTKRSDDEEESIRLRLRQYNKSIDGILENFEDVLHHIDGSKSIEEIHDDIMEIIKNGK